MNSKVKGVLISVFLMSRGDNLTFLYNYLSICKKAHSSCQAPLWSPAPRPHHPMN